MCLFLTITTIVFIFITGVVFLVWSVAFISFDSPYQPKYVPKVFKNLSLILVILISICMFLISKVGLI